MIYTVHVQPQDKEGAQARFLRDGFSVPALVLGPLWLLYHRIWRGLIGWVVVSLVLFWLGRMLALSPFQSGLLSQLVAVFFGFEGADLLRAALERRGWPMVDLVAARRLEEAERIFYSRWRGPVAAAPRPLPIPLPAAAQVVDGGFLQIFPEKG